MIAYPKCGSFNGLLAGILLSKPANLELGYGYLMFHKDQLLYLNWTNCMVTVIQHDVVYNTNRLYKLPGMFDSIEQAVHQIAESQREVVFLPGQDGPRTSFDPEDQNNPVVSANQVLPVLQALANTSVDGNEIEQSFRILYGVEVPFKVVRIYLNGGLKVQRKTEAGPGACTFEDLVTYLTSPHES